MTELIITRYIHFLSFLLVFATVFAEAMLIKPTLTRASLKKILRIDGLYGLFAMSTLGAGLYLWFGTGKPASFYNVNYLFHIKITLFLLVGILSIWPTVFYTKNRKGDDEEQVEVPKHIIRIVKIELMLLILIPMFAALMAQGVGI